MSVTKPASTVEAVACYLDCSLHQDNAAPSAMGSDYHFRGFAVVATLVTVELIVLFWSSEVFDRCPAAVCEGKCSKFHADIAILAPEFTPAIPNNPVLPMHRM